MAVERVDYYSDEDYQHALQAEVAQEAQARAEAEGIDAAYEQAFADNIVLSSVKMSEKTQEFLKVLDLPDANSQIDALKPFISQEDWAALRANHLSLADLAFRLRDEAVKRSISYWRDGQLEVFDKVILVAEPVKYGFRWRIADIDMWFARYARPKHFIVAAFIAKDLAGKAE